MSKPTKVIIIPIVLVALITILTITISVWMLVINKPDEPVDNYYQCTQKTNSRIQESYPEVCVTEDGQRFTNPEQQAPSAP